MPSRDGEAHRSPAMFGFLCGRRLLLRAEIDLGRLHLIGGDVERRHLLGGRIEEGPPQAAREGRQLGIVDAHRIDVVAPRNRDAVLGALDLALQREEVLARLDVGIALDDREQPPERAAELGSARPETSAWPRGSSGCRAGCWPAPAWPWRAPRPPRSAPCAPAWRSL